MRLEMFNICFNFVFLLKKHSISNATCTLFCKSKLFIKLNKSIFFEKKTRPPKNFFFKLRFSTDLKV